MNLIHQVGSLLIPALSCPLPQLQGDIKTIGNHQLQHLHLDCNANGNKHVSDFFLISRIAWPKLASRNVEYLGCGSVKLQPIPAQIIEKNNFLKKYIYNRKMHSKTES